ncbi:MAG: hypothetical protein K9I55_06215 [Haliscomenobacter sp.]|nr:hypothetical protein [Haliscomenobacter sp.]
MEKRILDKWILLSFISLFIVAILGVLMRYKISFSFPYLDQKNLQNAHSHFAFLGWISQTVYLLLINTLGISISKKRVQFYHFFLGANWISAFGMLIAFSSQGYAFFSMAFSLFSMILSFLFSVIFWKDVKMLQNKTAGLWFKFALICMLISTLGTIALIIMLATKSVEQQTYLISIYWYLHFQYNGWFFFSIIGLLFNHFGESNEYFKINRLSFKLLAFSALPAFGLSVLWLHLPLWLLIIIALAAIFQTIGWALLVYNVFEQKVLKDIKINDYVKWLLLIIAITGSIKFCLQLGSTIPSISQLAFGFRPIVIAYLHLVLLAFLSLLLIAYMFLKELVDISKIAFIGMIIFVFGILINEILLAMQGILSFKYILIPNINYYLFATSLVLLTGTFLLALAQFNLIKKIN